MMQRIELGAKMTVRSPFLFPGTAAGVFGLDGTAMRDRQGRLMIPQDQIRGVLRHAMMDVAKAAPQNGFAATDIDKLFGRKSGDALADDPQELSNEPDRGRLLFGDLVASSQYPSGQAVRVEIDPDTLAAKPGHLVVVEQAAPNGVDVTFEGRLVLFATEGEGKVWLAALDAATSYVSAIGAMKTAGFGEVSAFVISEQNRASLLPTNMEPVGKERRTYDLAIDRPFLVDSHRVADNAYIGSEVIPGAVIKGLLARKMALCGLEPEKNDWLTRLSISHASVSESARVLPLSMVCVRDDAVGTRFGDALQVPLTDGALIGGNVARFRCDWKEAEFKQAYEWQGVTSVPELGRDVRTHVAITHEEGVAAESQLYVTSAVDPADHCWQVTVDFSRIEDAQARAELAAMLESGLDGMGRTGASVSFEVCDGSSWAGPAKPVHWRKDAFAVILQTDAVMAGQEDGEDTFAAYAAYWQRVCPGATLENFFTSHRLAGGYIALRGNKGDGLYRPFYLTESGSVFLLSGNIGERLNELIRDGLPAPVVGGQTLDWRRCLYQPENGYGRIRADYDAALTSEVRHG
jgi:hypothetical protein